MGREVGKGGARGWVGGDEEKGGVAGVVERAGRGGRGGGGGRLGGRCGG